MISRDPTGSVEVDEAVIAACATQQERLREVHPSWLSMPGLQTLLAAMQAIDARDEVVDFDSLRAELRGREHETRGGWWSTWADWWATVMPHRPGNHIDWPTVRETVRDSAIRRTVRDLLLKAVIACETGEVADALLPIEQALRVLRRVLPADDAEQEAA